VTLVLFAATIAFFAATIASATSTWQFETDNWNNGENSFPSLPASIDSGQTFALPGGPSATIDGAAWLNTGSGPQLLAQDMCYTCLVMTSSGWQPCGDAYQYVKYHYVGYPGYFLGEQATMSNNVTTFGTEHIQTLSMGSQTYTLGEFEIQAWVDPGMITSNLTDRTPEYTSYQAAFAASAAHQAGVYVGTTAPFLGDLLPYGSVWGADNSCKYMPALILATAVSVPEPGTLGLLAVAWTGLLAYTRWRRK
jgi:hypothetical protein